MINDSRDLIYNSRTIGAGEESPMGSKGRNGNAANLQFLSSQRIHWLDRVMRSNELEAIREVLECTPRKRLLETGSQENRSTRVEGASSEQGETEKDCDSDENS